MFRQETVSRVDSFLRKLVHRFSMGSKEIDDLKWRNSKVQSECATLCNHRKAENFEKANILFRVDQSTCIALISARLQPQAPNLETTLFYSFVKTLLLNLGGFRVYTMWLIQRLKWHVLHCILIEYMY